MGLRSLLEYCFDEFVEVMHQNNNGSYYGEGGEPVVCHILMTIFPYYLFMEGLLFLLIHFNT